jgi:hypothetical protein
MFTSDAILAAYLIANAALLATLGIASLFMSHES